MSQSNQSTAALLIGFKRIDFLQNRLSELSKNSSIPILVSIDGSDKVTENLIAISINDFILRHTEMHIRFKVQEKNLGLAQHVTHAISEVLKEYDKVIVIEDDIVLSETFIDNMLGGLHLMKTKENIGVVGAFSVFTGQYIKIVKSKWRISAYFPAWGWGITREKWNDYQLEIPSNYLEVLGHSQTWQSLSRYRKIMWTYRFKKVTCDNPYTWDYQMQYLLFRRDLVALLPTNRISDNEGFESVASSNTKGKRPRWMGKERVFAGILQSKISKVSKIYEIGDAFTIAGDTRLAEKMARFSKMYVSARRKNS